MSDGTGAAIARALAIWVLIFAALGFGLVALCGAVFTAFSLPDLCFRLFTGNHDGFFTTPSPGVGFQLGAGTILTYSLPALLIGGGVGWWCVRKLWTWWKA